ncbi:MAG TPA: Rdx family protein [Halobacteriales archaeon]|nr:Rdx family protein [Halobacteriales archaeon]
MTTVEIEYCVPCGLLDRAIETQRELLAEYGQRLDAVTLRTGDGGVFVVRADGDVVLDTDERGYDVDEIADAIGDRLESGA